MRRRLKLYMAFVAEDKRSGKYYPYMVWWNCGDPVELCKFILEHNICESFIFRTKIAAVAKVEELRSEYREKNLLAFDETF